MKTKVFFLTATSRKNHQGPQAGFMVSFAQPKFIIKEK
jgi:hypothetical protein